MESGSLSGPLGVFAHPTNRNHFGRSQQDLKLKGLGDKSNC